MDGAQFSVDPEEDEGFYVTVGEELTVYEQYDAAVAEVQQKVLDRDGQLPRRGLNRQQRQ